VSKPFLLEKPCTRCGVVKPRSEFPKKGKRPREIKSHCRACESARQSERHHARKASDPEYALRYRVYNREYARARSVEYNAYRRQRYQESREVRLRDRIRLQIFRHLRCGKGGRTSAEVLGYTSDDLRVHLERQFSRGMTWANYGSHWHIDHIVPVSSFRLTLEDGSPDWDAVRRCWALSNLRPLRAAENISKGGKVIYLV